MAHCAFIIAKSPIAVKILAGQFIENEVVIPTLRGEKIMFNFESELDIFQDHS